MRTTLALDDDVFAAVRELARTKHQSLGETLSALVRKALRPSASNERVRNGVPLLAVAPGTERVTSELVRQLDQELP